MQRDLIKVLREGTYNLELYRGPKNQEPLTSDERAQVNGLVDRKRVALKIREPGTSVWSTLTTHPLGDFNGQRRYLMNMWYSRWYSMYPNGTETMIVVEESG